MKYEDLSWFNQQLAAMLREGLPVSGALRELTSTMNRGELRTQFETIHNRLEQGESLDRAVLQTTLPPLYKAMVAAGVKSGDMPGALGFTADYYSTAAQLERRVRALFMYPTIVLLVGLGVSVLISRLNGMLDLQAMAPDMPDSRTMLPWMLGFILLSGIVGLSFPRVRNWLFWRVPGVREGRASQIAASAAMLLRQGVPLPDTVRMIRELEGNSPVGYDLDQWEKQLEAGSTDLVVGAAQWRGLPVMLGSFLQNSRSNLAEGFHRASLFFKERASNQIEVMLQAGAPILVVLMGILVSSQLFRVLSGIVAMLNSLGGE